MDDAAEKAGGVKDPAMQRTRKPGRKEKPEFLQETG
jgi:hypothetical protein